MIQGGMIIDIVEDMIEGRENIMKRKEIMIEDMVGMKEIMEDMVRMKDMEDMVRMKDMGDMKNIVDMEDKKDVIDVIHVIHMTDVKVVDLVEIDHHIRGIIGRGVGVEKDERRNRRTG